MKIVFMTSGTIKSSLSHRAFSFATELSKKGHSVYIFCPSIDKYSSFKKETITKIKGVNIIRPLQIKSVPFIVGLIPYIFHSIILLFRLNPDIIHIQKATPVTLGALLVKFFKRTPIIFDSDDLDAQVMKVEGHSQLVILSVILSEKITSAYANAITAASKYLTTYYINKFKKKKILYVPNGTNFKKQSNSLLKAKINNRIVFLGNINRKNILEPLFYATKILKTKISISVLIIGSGTYLDYFRKLSIRLNISKYVKFLGHIQYEHLYKYINRGDLGYCYMPSESTTIACSNVKVFEYMKLSAIPIISDIGDLPTYISYGKAGYIAKSNNTVALTNTIMKALSNKLLMHKKIDYIEAHSASLYDWSILANKINDLYKQVI